MTMMITTILENTRRKNQAIITWIWSTAERINLKTAYNNKRKG